MNSGDKNTVRKGLSREEINSIIAKARRQTEERLKGYREQSLKIHPWVCARCGRDFNHKNIHLLTVHHRDHNHDNNPPDGSNWENLCIYCHDNEHRRDIDYTEGETDGISNDSQESIKHKPFAALAELMKNK